MGLSHLKKRREDVQVGDESFSVRGLNFDDITLIVRANLAPLSELFARIQRDEAGDFSLDDPASLASALANAAPSAVAMIIARATDEEDLSLVANVPFPAQIEALEKIGKLTFATEGGPKKVLETIIRVANGATSTLAGLKA